MNWKYFTQQWPYFKGHLLLNVNPMKFNGLFWWSMEIKKSSSSVLSTYYNYFTSYKGKRSSACFEKTSCHTLIRKESRMVPHLIFTIVLDHYSQNWYRLQNIEFNIAKKYFSVKTPMSTTNTEDKRLVNNHDSEQWFFVALYVVTDKNKLTERDV